SDAGDVVGQGIDPDIHHMLGVIWHLDAPIERRARDRQIPQTALDEADDLVAARIRADEVGLRLIKVEQSVLVSRELEEIALLLHPLHRRALRTEPYVF